VTIKGGEQLITVDTREKERERVVVEVDGPAYEPQRARELESERKRAARTRGQNDYHLDLPRVQQSQTARLIFVA
jgi:hypothetical protein